MVSKHLVSNKNIVQMGNLGGTPWVGNFRMRSLAHYKAKLVEKGLSGLIRDRYRWYKFAFQMDNWFFGRLVELLGNRVRIQGVRLYVDNPLVTTRHKGSLFFGIYENAERELVKRYLDKSLPTVELGGSIGGIACMVGKMLLDPTRHVVLECNPMLIPTLKKNRDVNGCKFEIEPLAIAYGRHSVSFTVTDHFMLGGVGNPANGQMVDVPTTSLRQILDKHRFDRINLISDCEGAEINLVEHEADLLCNRVDRLIVEIHELVPGTIDRTIAKICKLGFVVKARLRGGVLAFENSRSVPAND